MVVITACIRDGLSCSCDGIRGQWEALESMLATGKTKSIAVSNFDNGQLDCIHSNKSYTPPAVNQMRYTAAMGLVCICHLLFRCCFIFRSVLLLACGLAFMVKMAPILFGYQCSVSCVRPLPIVMC
jgi:hypothetical protein